MCAPFLVLVSDRTAPLSESSPRNDVKTVIIHVGGNDMKTDVDPTTLKSQYKEYVLQLKHTFPLARVLFTGIPPRKNTPGEVRRACSGCLCGLCVHLGRRSSGVTAGTGLWSSVVKAVGPNP